MDDAAPDVAAERVGSEPVQRAWRSKTVGGIDAERIEAADKLGARRTPYEQHHDDETDGAEHVAWRQEGEAPPAMGRLRAGASQFAVVVDRGHGISPHTGCADRSRRRACRR